jgi:hypothetical protein
VIGDPSHSRVHTHLLESLQELLGIILYADREHRRVSTPHSTTHPLANLATLSKFCDHFAVECGCGYSSAFRLHHWQADQLRRQRDLGRGLEEDKSDNGGRIRTECVEVLHVHAMREAKRKEKSWG